MPEGLFRTGEGGQARGQSFLLRTAGPQKGLRPESVHLTIPYVGDPEPPLFEKENIFVQVNDLQPPHRLTLLAGSTRP